MYIVQGQQAEPEYLVGDEKVADVCAGEAGTGRAIAVDVERPRVGAEFGALDVQPALMGEDRPVATDPGWGDTVEKIHSPRHALDEVFRKPHSHQVARVSPWQCVVDYVQHLVHRWLFFAN